MTNNPKPFNESTKWITYALTYEKMAKRIARKYTTDTGLLDDCTQEALIALCQIVPEKDIKVYAQFRRGKMTREQWEKSVDAFCRTTIRNAVNLYLRYPKTGSWDVSRTRKKKRSDGSVKETFRPHVESLDQLLDSGAIQISQEGQVHWMAENPGHTD